MSRFDGSEGWLRTRLARVTPLDPRLDAVARAIGATHVNGGARIARFEIHADPAVADYFAHDRIDADFFRHFFGHPDVMRAFPHTSPTRDALGFHQEAGPAMREMLIKLIRDGGAYRTFKGTEKQAAALAADFAAAIGPRFATAGAWVSFEPWSAWFQDVAWDYSFFWFDRGTGIATVLLITDTD